MQRRRWLWLLLIIILLAGGGYYYYTTLQSQPMEVTNDEPDTAPVSRGDIILTTLGVGTLLPSKEVNLSFGSSGTIKTLTVQVGDRISPGEVLATLDDTEIRLQVMQSTLDLRLAEIALAELQAESDPAEIAAARATLATAKADYDALLKPPSEAELLAARSTLLSAQQTLNTLLSGLSVDEQITLQADLLTTEIALQQAQAAYNQIAWRQDVGATSQAASLQEATIAYEKALAQYNLSAAGPNQAEITNAQANIAQAEASLSALQEGPDTMTIAASLAKIEQAEAELADLQHGASTEALETAALAVQKAMYNLDADSLALAGSVIESPIAGVITAIVGQTGEQAGTSAVITVAEADTAQVRFWVEEFDIANVVVGYPVNIIFEAFPEQTFTGQISRVEPTLVEVDGALAVQTWATLDLNQHPVRPIFGMNAEVEIIAGEATNAMLVPLQALRELVPGSFAVFIINDSGELELRPVEVGLRDFVNAEIKLGLDGSETISIGTE